MRLFLSFKKQFSFVILVALVLSFFAANAQIQSYTDSWGSSGISLKSESKSVVTLNFSITEFQLIDNEVDGLPMKDIIMPQVFLPNDEGAPNLPALSRYIAVPQGAQANIIIKSYRTELLKDISIAPAPRIPLDTEDGPLQYRKNEKIYNSDVYYPAEPFLLSELTQLRGVDAVMFGITPFQYNPISKELLVYRDVELDIVFEGGNGHFGDDRLRSRWYDPILEDALLNYSSLPIIDYDARGREYRNLDNAGFEYLIVIPNNPIWMPYAEQIKEWRTKQGILTGIKTLNDIGGSTVTILENYFNNAFNNWTIPPVAVLLMADYGTNANNSIISPIYGNDGASDNIFADVTGNHLPDMIFARMTAQNATHLQTMVSKMLNYESNPPTNPNFYNNPITALGWHTDRWFQICSEVVGGFWRQQGKLPVRINGVSSGFPSWIWSTATNTSQVVNYFGPNGQGYIPATPAELGGFIGGTAQMVVNAINSGAFALQHRDHGYEDGWGEPAFKSSHIDSLKNNQNNELVYVFSINSLTGKYNISGECFAEKFHRYTYGGKNAGALGVIAASEAVYSFVSDVFLWGMFDNMYPEFMPDYGNNVPMRGFLPAFGQAAGKIFLQSSQWPYNSDGKESTYNLFHAHGGAFLQVFTEVPQNLAVTHNPILYSSESSFNVIAPAGAFISLTVNGEIIGTAMSNGGSTNIAIEPQLPPNPMVVTVTKQNYYRYESNVDIISPSGPCVIADSFVINDASGNNNGLMDYGESIMLHMTMKNVSMAAANNVSTTMTSNNAYVTITNGNAYFGNIAPNSTVTVNNAFSFTVSPNIPDSHAVSFILNSTDGADNWISYISIVGHAPNIKFKQYVINDEGGNGNGLLDPGEIAPMIITVENQGSLTAYNVVGMLTTTDPNVTILTSQPQSMDDINAGGTSTCEFIVSASANIPAGYTADLTLNLNADFGVTQQTTFYLLFPDYCYPTANCSLGDGFNGFALEQINNMTGNGCSPNGYGDYTNMVADLQGGQKYTVQWRSGFSNQRASLWIDLNDNKEFESSEILINEFELLTPNQVYSTIFTVPEGDYTGYRRIRIRAHFHNTPPHPCVAYVYGETEDYTANFGNQATLAPPQNVAANVIGDSVVVTWQAPARADATLLGYNVYRDNTLLDMVTGNEYFDLDLPAGTYSYEVTAVYDQGESMPAGPVTVSILDPPTLLIAEQRGTKVFLKWKSNFVGKGVLADGSNKAKDFLDSYTGNTLTEDMQLRLFGGSYQSNQVHSDIRCEVECPAGAINESELCGEDLNGGCGSDPEVFESIAIGDVICGTVWADNGSRDTDWYELIVTESKIITWKVTAEFPVRVFILDGNNGCDDFGIIIYVFAQPCEPIIAMTTVSPGTYWLCIANQDFYGNPCWESNNYVFELTAEDVFLPYFKLYRNDVVIGEIYDLYHYDDAIAPGNEYCYSVSEVVSEEGLETAKSNEICVNIPDGALAVTPGSLNETHSEPLQLTTKILTVSNTGNGPIEFDAVVDFLGKGNHASVAGPDREIDPKWVAEQYEQHAALERYPNPASDNVHNVKATAQPVGGEHYTSYITSDPSRAELYNNGPFITHPGGGAGGKGASAVQTNLGMSGLGYLVNHSASPGSYYYLADDFEVTGAWNLEEIKFYAYQTGSGATSTFTGVYVQIWDGAPNAGGVVVWGDLTKNRKISTKNISVYRVLDTGLQNTDHRIMEIVADMSGCILNAGTYWVQWGLTGSASSGPWGVPVTILGQTTTGNGLRATSTGWQNWQDGGTSTGQGGAFIIKGTSGQHIKDVGVLEISAPNTGYLTGAEEVKFIIKNYGIAAQYKIPWTVNVYGPDTSSLIGVYAGTLAPGATAEITAGMANLSTYGNYSFWACTHLTGDEHSGNNCEFKDVTIIGPFCVENLYSTGCSLGDGLTSWDFANSIVDIPCFGFLPWYHDYRDMVYEVERGHTYVLTVTAGSENTYFDVWIDFNDDFVFSNADELILNDGLCATANAPYTFNITIPVDAPGGTHVIRYRTNYFLPVTDPCATYDFGNATDFMVSIPPWISIEPSAGILNAGESMNVFVFFNSAGLDYGVYNADILFASNNPFITQPEVTVPVQLTVGGVPSQDILMPLGWSGWSAYINMLGASFENVVAPVVNDMIITQHFTEVFWPQYGINTMGNFTNDHGYVSKMSAFATLSLEGMVAAPTVALNAGWNLFPILVDCNLDAAEVFGGITGFIIGYEVAGNGIYYPAGSIATLTTLVPGKAYWVKVSGAATYTFPECIGGTKASYIAPLRHANNTPWNEPTYTGSSHIVVFDAEASVSFAKGDMIGAFTNDGACAGLTLCDGKAVSLALFADDITTLVNDGFVQGEFITFKLYRQSNDTEYILDVSYSSQAPNYDGLFEANGLSVINNVTMYATGIGSQDLNSLTVYPNPSQGIFNVSVNNLFQDVNWVVTDAKGRYVMEGRLADSHQIDLRTQPKGIYFIKFTGDNVLCIKKLVLR